MQKSGGAVSAKIRKNVFMVRERKSFSRRHEQLVFLTAEEKVNFQKRHDAFVMPLTFRRFGSCRLQYPAALHAQSERQGHRRRSYPCFADAGIHQKDDASGAIRGPFPPAFRTGNKTGIAAGGANGKTAAFAGCADLIAAAPAAGTGNLSAAGTASADEFSSSVTDKADSCAASSAVIAAYFSRIGIKIRYTSISAAYMA